MQLFSTQVVPRHLSLARLQRIKQWHRAQQVDQPIEYLLWDAVLTLWLMGWIGWLPVLAFGTTGMLPLCAIGMLLPQLYVRMRACAHARGKLRCDWLNLLR